MDFRHVFLWTEKVQNIFSFILFLFFWIQSTGGKWGEAANIWFGLVYSFIQPATNVALDMSVQITARENNQLKKYGHLSIKKTKCRTNEAKL